MSRSIAISLFVLALTAFGPLAARAEAPAKSLVAEPSASPQAANNKIDELVLANLKKLGIPPSELCSDEVFIRRVYLDVIGKLPAPEETRAFLQDQAADKRSKLIDRLLDREEYADCLALKWSELLRIKSEPVRLWPKGAHAFHQWVRDAMLENRPYDQFVREMLTATGSNFRYPPVNFYRINPPVDNVEPSKPIPRSPQAIAETTALVFMGVRILPGGAGKWGLEDNLGLAAFFSKLAYKPTLEWKEEIIYVDPKGVLTHPKTKEAVKPKYLGGEVVELGEDEDPREKLAAWLTRPENPYFAKNIVNRVWSWYLGRGIIHEPDDLRPDNPPSNPELLAYLEKDFIEHKHDLKRLVRSVLNSKTYQFASTPNEGNKGDTAHFSHYYARRLAAEVLLDAIGQVTESFERFASDIPEPVTVLPEGFPAVQLYDGAVVSPFLEVFGRSPRDTGYESERNLSFSQVQAMFFFNSPEVQALLNGSPRIKRWIAEKKPDEEIADELYMLALCRAARPDEKKQFVECLAKARATAQNAPKRRDKKDAGPPLDPLVSALQDAVWTVLNSKQFLLNH